MLVVRAFFEMIGQPGLRPVLLYETNKSPLIRCLDVSTKYSQLPSQVSNLQSEESNNTSTRPSSSSRDHDFQAKLQPRTEFSNSLLLLICVRSLSHTSDTLSLSTYARPPLLILVPSLLFPTVSITLHHSSTIRPSHLLCKHALFLDQTPSPILA